MGFLNLIKAPAVEHRETITEDDFDRLVKEAILDGKLGYQSPVGLPKRTQVTKTVHYRFGKLKTTRKETEVL